MTWSGSTSYNRFLKPRFVNVIESTESNSGYFRIFQDPSFKSGFKIPVLKFRDPHLFKTVGYLWLPRVGENLELAYVGICLAKSPTWGGTRVSKKTSYPRWV